MFFHYSYLFISKIYYHLIIVKFFSLKIETKTIAMLGKAKNKNCRQKYHLPVSQWRP